MRAVDAVDEMAGALGAGGMVVVALAGVVREGGAKATEEAMARQEVRAE